MLLSRESVDYIVYRMDFTQADWDMLSLPKQTIPSIAALQGLNIYTAHWILFALHFTNAHQLDGQIQTYHTSSRELCMHVISYICQQQMPERYDTKCPESCSELSSLTQALNHSLRTIQPSLVPMPLSRGHVILTSPQRFHHASFHQAEYLLSPCFSYIMNEHVSSAASSVGVGARSWEAAEKPGFL